MATARAKQLQKLSMSLPEANQKMANAQQQARQVQLQESIRGAQPGTGAPRLAQQMGAQQQAQSGQIQLQQGQKTQQGLQQVAQEGLAQQARGQREAGFQQQIALSKEQQAISDRMARLGTQVKSELLDNQLRFNKNQAGQTVLNERQLADWAVTQAKSREEFADYAQAAQQVYDREIQILETANKKITQKLQQEAASKEQKLDQELKKKLLQQQKELERQINDKKNAAANRNAMWSAGLGAVGTVAGAFFGGPTGAMAGGAMGQGVGNIISGLTG